MDITSLRNISSGAVKSAADTYLTELRNGQDIQEDEAFGSLFDKAVQNLNITNAYLSDAENEKIKWALGETENTHDLTNALQKASTALSYTVAVRDKFLEAYKEIMQIQI